MEEDVEEGHGRVDMEEDMEGGHRRGHGRGRLRKKALMLN